MKLKKNSSLKNNNIFKIFITFVLGVFTGVLLENHNYIGNFYNRVIDQKFVTAPKIQHYNISELARGKISTCFTPPSGCTTFIAKEIDKAKESIYMQAYGMSDQLITSALIDAKSRGVKVKILLDRSNLKQRFSKLHELQRAKIEVGIDKVPGIAHNKVIIIDRQKVITGSFNFTVSADKRNAENVLVIDNKDLANAYLQNWLSRKNSNIP